MKYSLTNRRFFSSIPYNSVFHTLFQPSFFTTMPATRRSQNKEAHPGLPDQTKPRRKPGELAKEKAAKKAAKDEQAAAILINKARISELEAELLSAQQDAGIVSKAKKPRPKPKKIGGLKQGPGKPAKVVVVNDEMDIEVSDVEVDSRALVSLRRLCAFQLLTLSLRLQGQKAQAHRWVEARAWESSRCG